MLEKIKEKFFTKQFLTFGLIGGMNTLIAQAIYMFCVKMAIPVGRASIIGDVLAMVFSYFMNMHFTYKQKPTLKSAITFPLSYIPGIIISAVVVILVVDMLGAPELYAKLIALPIYVPVNYLCMSFIVKTFGKKE